MAELAWRHSWLWALLLFGLYGLLSPDWWSTVIGLGLLGTWALEGRAIRRAAASQTGALPSGRGAQTALAGVLMILGGLLHLAQVGPLQQPTTPEGVQTLARLFLAVSQLLWTIGEVRRFRREVEQAG
ncbi:MAG TPA: hypothetical protein VK191_01655 [Symbiobacteriaceae bacterium]|nr:hypothetical protein [Symbiobacteriaceae bacterium]